MLTMLFRSIVIFVLLVMGIRVMGKRTIGELQPYEFVITLVVADLAVTPMQDISVPLLYGIVPLFTVFSLHYFITLLTSKSIWFRKLINGKPFVVIDDDGLNYETMSKLNIDVNDMLALIRQQGYFSPAEISYAVIETNGKLSVLENSTATAPQTIPMTLVVEGKLINDNLAILGLSVEKVSDFLASNGFTKKDVLLMTAESGTVYLQPMAGKFTVIEGANI